MYIFLNRGLGMSTGKAAAQSAHAAVEAYIKSQQNQRLGEDGRVLLEEWRLGLHYTKIVLEARDEAHLRNIERYLTDRWFDSALIIDEGRTEIEPMSVTALGVEIVDKDDPHTKATFEHFELYKDAPRDVEAEGCKAPHCWAEYGTQCGTCPAEEPSRDELIEYYSHDVEDALKNPPNLSDLVEPALARVDDAVKIARALREFKDMLK